MPDPTVCAAIVTYNSARYIRRCLEAVIRQEGVPIEIVVVDNGSTDGAAAVRRQSRGRGRVIHCGRNLVSPKRRTAPSVPVRPNGY